MNFLDTQPMDLQGLAGEPGGLAEFRVSAPAEVAALLKKLLDGGELVNLNAPGGLAYTTRLWTIDTAAGLIGFSADGDDARVQQLVDAQEVAVVGYLDSIKLQFDLRSVVLVRGGRHSALRAPIPRTLYRFQRRSSYRVRPLSRSTPLARLRHPSIPEMALALRVVDVSIGGCALFLPDDVPPLSPGVTLNEVSIELDADTHFVTGLRVQHVSALNPQARGTRLGCAMVSTARDAERALQRYIDQTQKKRRLFSLD